MTDDTPASPTVPPAAAAQWPITARYGVGILLAVIGAAVVLLILPLLQVILVSFLIAFVMFVPSRAMSRAFGLPYRLCVLLAFLLAAVLVFIVLLFFVPELLRLVHGTGVAIQQAYQQFVLQLQAIVPSQAYLQLPAGAVDLNSLIAMLQQIFLVSSNAPLVQIAQILVSLIAGVFTSLAGLAVILGTASIVALFFLIELPISSGTMTDWVPVAYRREVALLFGKLDRLWLGFFRAELIIGLMIGVASFVVFLVFGLQGALVLAVISAILCLIPIIGRVLALVPIILSALVYGSSVFTVMTPVALVMLVIVVHTLVIQLINSIAGPRLKGTAVNVPAVVIIIGVMVGLAAAGIIGALLIAPIIGSLRLLVQYAVSKIFLRDPYPDEQPLPVQQEGFFSHMLYVTKPGAAAKPRAKTGA